MKKRISEIVARLIVWVVFGKQVAVEEVIKKTPRDYALEMHGVIAGLPSNERDAALYTLIRLTHPKHHLHGNPTKKQRQQQTEIAA